MLKIRSLEARLHEQKTSVRVEKMEDRGDGVLVVQATYEATVDGAYTSTDNPELLDKVHQLLGDGSEN